MSTPSVLRGIMEAGNNERDKKATTNGTIHLESSDVPENLEIQNGGSKVIGAGPSFIEYLRSRVIEISVGTGAGMTILTAHEKLLLRSPFLVDAIATLGEDKRVELPCEHLDAMGSFLEFLYTGDYYPRKIGDHLEGTPVSTIDDGTELLRHAHVYILAEKLGVADLKDLAHSKVYHVNSTAKGEVTYARFVYGNTSKSDTTIREPIAAFWGQRSHVLRHDVEAEFHALCTDFPEFAFDVLSHVLDSRERKSKEKERERERESTVGTRAETPKTGRKRMRQI